MRKLMRKLILPVSIVASALLFSVSLAQAQSNFDSTEQLSKTELKELVAPIALYPDDLVAVVLPSSAYPLQLVQAKRLLDDGGQPDANWDESVVAVMNYPEIVEFLNEDLDWTYSLGLAFINQEAATFDAIQAFRSDALAAGNLRSDEYQVVRVDRGIIRIESRSEKEIYIPYYEPQHVVVRHVAPVYYYYPVARPIYYYPYPAHYSFRVNHFYGVGTYFSMGWHYRGLSLHYSTGTGHPYAGHYYSPRHYYFKPRVKRHYYGGKRHHYKPRHFARHNPRHVKPVRHKTRHKVRHAGKHAKARVWQPRHRPAVAKHNPKYRPAANRHVTKKHVAKRHAPKHKAAKRHVVKHKVARRHNKSPGFKSRKKATAGKNLARQGTRRHQKNQQARTHTAKNQPDKHQAKKARNHRAAEGKRAESRRTENKARGRHMAANNRAAGNGRTNNHRNSGARSARGNGMR